MHGWKEAGDEILFISQYRGKSEDYSDVEPVVLGYSGLFRIVDKLYFYLNRKKIEYSSSVEDFKMHYGFPSVRQIKKTIYTFNPNIIILRERSLYNLITYQICKKKYKCLLYNQNPMYIMESEVQHKDLFHRIIRKAMPQLRMTPVLGNVYDGHRDMSCSYIPFVMQQHISFEQKKYFMNNKVNIICISKYEERKNLLMLLETIKDTSFHEDIHLVIAGEVSTNHHHQYYEQITEYINNNNLRNQVTLYQNFTRDEIFRLYEQADLFVLPSTREFASVSQLEAMSFSMPVICSNTNGTSCYIENGVNGYIFEDNNKIDLQNKLECLLNNRNEITAMGKESSRLIMEKYQFQQYKEQIQGIVTNKRLLFVVATMQGGGTERVIAILSNYFANRGIDVTILMTAGDEVSYSLHSEIHVISIGGSTSGRVINRLKRMKRMRKIFRMFRGQNIISFGTETNVWSILSDIGLHNRLVLSERNDPNQCTYPMIRNAVYALGDYFVFQTEDAAKCFSRRIQNRSTVIGNPITGELPEIYRGERRNVIAAVGRLNEQKNYPLLITSFQKFLTFHPEYELEIYGKGELEQELKEICKNLKIEKQVRFCGFHTDVMSRIRDCKMYVLSSDYEGISNSLLEAMAIGMPVISTDCPIGGAKMCIRHGENGLLVPIGNNEALVNAMQLIANNKHRATEMGKRASQIRILFSKNEIGKKWQEILW